MDGKLHEGHRSRIDAKVRVSGLEFLEEHEQLERLLFAVMPRGNTNELAKMLLNEFGSFYNVLTADVSQLKRIEGVGHRTAEFLHDMMPLLGIVERSVISQGKGKALLDTTEKIGDYAKSLFNGKLVENLYMISLNSHKGIICFDKISEGTSHVAAASIHTISKRALLNEASYVVLAHNHPGGKLEPSVADLSLTREVKLALDTLDIKLIDHIIVACGKWLSLMDR